MSEPGFSVGRFGRIVAVISFVTGVFMFLIATRLGGDLFRIGAVAVGTVAFLTTLVGYLIAAGSAYDA